MLNVLGQNPATDLEFRTRVQDELVKIAKQKQEQAGLSKSAAENILVESMVREPQRFTWTYAHAICVLDGALTLASSTEEIRNAILAVWNILAS